MEINDLTGNVRGRIIIHRRDGTWSGQGEIKTDAEREGHGDKTLAASLSDLSMTSLPMPLSALAFLCASAVNRF
jgi:hypothetical protein